MSWGADRRRVNLRIGGSSNWHSTRSPRSGQVRATCPDRGLAACGPPSAKRPPVHATRVAVGGRPGRAKRRRRGVNLQVGTLLNQDTSREWEVLSEHRCGPVRCETLDWVEQLSEPAQTCSAGIAVFNGLRPIHPCTRSPESSETPQSVSFLHPALTASQSWRECLPENLPLVFGVPLHGWF